MMPLVRGPMLLQDIGQLPPTLALEGIVVGSNVGLLPRNDGDSWVNRVPE